MHKNQKIPDKKNRALTYGSVLFAFLPYTYIDVFVLYLTAIRYAGRAAPAAALSFPHP